MGPRSSDWRGLVAQANQLPLLIPALRLFSAMGCTSKGRNLDDTCIPTTRDPVGKIPSMPVSLTRCTAPVLCSPVVFPGCRIEIAEG